MASRGLFLTTRPTRPSCLPSIRASTVTIRSLSSSSPCRTSLPQPQHQQPPPPPPEYDYDPSLDHRFFPRLAREFRLSRQLKTYHANIQRLAERTPKFVQRRRRILHISVASCVLVILYCVMNIEVVPETGRWRCNLFSLERFNNMIDRHSSQEVESKTSSIGGRVVPDSDPRAQRVKRVLAHLLPVSGLGRQRWETYVIETSKEFQFPTAFVVSGTVGKIYIFDDLLEHYATTDTHLAGMLAHELAHARVQHNSEGCTWRTLAVLFLHTASLMLLKKGSPLTLPFKYFGLCGVGFGVYTVLFDLPMRREFETEADLVGLEMMAEAGYDPRDMLLMWKNMERIDGPQSNLFRTHPPVKQRFQDIKDWMPKAMKKWEQSAYRGKVNLTEALETYTQEVTAVALPADESEVLQ